MKKLILISLGFVFGLSVAAKQISYDDALADACSFFAPQASSRKAVKGISKSLTLAYTLNQPQKDVPALYVFNRGKNEGFVLVAADDQSKKILGYSYTGSFDATDMPEHVQFWLERYAEQIRVLSENGALFTTNAKKYTPVASLFGGDKKGILWRQRDPWNRLCPAFDKDGVSTRTLTGCVSTAVSQIMLYYRWPEKGKGEIDYTFKAPDKTDYTITKDLSGSTYEYDKMLNVYTADNFTEEQGNAVALLCYDVGIASEMSYGFSLSSTSNTKAASALVKNFDYDKSICVYYLDYDNEEHFLSIIQEDLLAGRPILVGGKTKGGAGHSFICDGIDEDGLLHINWGWSGLSNGYFELTNLNPKDQGDGGSSSGYTESVHIVAGIQKQQGSDITQYCVTTARISHDLLTKQGYRIEENENILPTMGKATNRGYTSYTPRFGSMTFENGAKQYSVDKNITYESVKDEKDAIVGYNFTLPVQDIAENLPIGCHDYAIVIRNSTNTSYQPLWVKGIGLAKNKVIITGDSLYYYPISMDWKTANLPQNLTATVDYADDQVQLSWEGNEGTFRVFVWNDTKLKTYVTAENNLTIPLCEDGTIWAVFQSDEVSKTDVALALSDLAFGDAIVIQNTATSVDDVPVSEAGVRVHGSQIDITTEETENIAIYDSLGHLLYQTKATYASFQAPFAGVYIVKIGAKKHKIWVK